MGGVGSASGNEIGVHEAYLVTDLRTAVTGVLWTILLKGYPSFLAQSPEDSPVRANGYSITGRDRAGFGSIPRRLLTFGLLGLPGSILGFCSGIPGFRGGVMLVVARHR